MTHPRRTDRARRDEPRGGAPHGAPPEAVRVRMLGGFRVSVGLRTVEEGEWRLRKAAGLVKLLGLAPGHRLHREQVMDRLWPDLGRKAASNNLRQALHAARRTFSPDPAAASRYLASQGESLVLCPGGDLWVDAEAFEQAAAAARRSGDSAAYRAAIELYAGKLLPEDRYEAWAEARREGLRGTYLALLLELAELYEGRGRAEDAIGTLGRALEAEPAREEAHARLMRLYALAGRRGEALGQYERLREALSRKLGVGPGVASRRLREEILAGRVPPSRTPPTGPLQNKSPDSDKHNLPAPRTSFVGWEREMVEIKRALAMTRLLTLTGAGGSGKTRLALEVAGDLVGAYPEGAWLVELAPLSEPELVPQVVARAVGVPEQSDRPLFETLVEALRGKSMLLILDNCEHLVDACARFTDTLLDACPLVRILATSREALGVGGESRWPMPPLSAPDPRRTPGVAELEGHGSVRLFVERARDRDPAFALTPQNARAVAEVCRRLDGIPLAVELAAARAGALAVEEIARRLEDSSPELLTGGTRTAVPRQRTLRGALDWSHELLGEPERALFGRLSVFAGGFSLGAAEAVGTAGGGIGEGDVLELLCGLADKSLVVAETTGGGGARYGMLEPVRQYARERLEGSGGAEEVRRRHAAFFLALAEEAEPEVRGPDQREWLGRLEAEHDNLRAALSWALGRGEAELALRLGGALWRFWARRGHSSEGKRWLEAAVARSDTVPLPVRAKALSGLGNLAERQDDYDLAVALHTESLALYQEQGDSRGAAAARGDLGWLAMLRGDSEHAMELLEESLARFRELGARWNAATMLEGLATIATSRSDHARASALLEESLELFREVGDSWYVAECLSGLGWLAVLKKDHERATKLLEEALARLRGAGSAPKSNYLIDLGLAAMLRGEHGRALELVEEGLALCRQQGDRWGIAANLEGMAILVGNHLGRIGQSARLWGGAQALRQVIGSPMRPDERSLYEPYITAARIQLGEEAWEAAWEEGKKMGIDEAIEYGLSQTRSALRAQEQPSTGEPAADLTRREQEVAELVARGLTNRRIAEELSISEHTAEKHVRKILKKLGVGSRVQIAARAAERRPLP